MKTSHAPGPWVVKSLSVYTDYGAGYRHKVADTRQPLFTRGCQEANARLIAAAPCLLACLEALVGEADLGEVDLDDDDRQLLADARAAIAKATGGQS